MFADTYKIALEAASLEDLKKKLDGIYLDERKAGNPFVTVAAQLAIEGEVEKVDWLRQLGANVDAIAYGYALVENHEQVDVYRDSYKACVDDIAQGYAQAGNDEHVERYRNDGASIHYIARGYALSGNDERVEVYRNDHEECVDALAQAYALIGNDGQVEIYQNDYAADVNFIAQGYALAGNHERVEAYRTEHNARVNAIVHSYAYVGNHEKVKEYFTEYEASVGTIVQGYAEAGNHERVEAYRIDHKVSVTLIAHAYAAAGNHEKQKEYEHYAINDLLANYLQKRTEVKDSSGITKEYFHSSIFSFFQKSFTQKSNAVTALSSALNGENVDLSEHLSTLRNGTLGQDLRKLIKSGMANSLVDKEVNTVSDFIQALQAKVSKNYQETPPI